MNDERNDNNMGSFSRANVKIAASKNIKIKANIIFPMYRKSSAGFGAFPRCEESEFYKSRTKIKSILAILNQIDKTTCTTKPSASLKMHLF